MDSCQVFRIADKFHYSRGYSHALQTIYSDDLGVSTTRHDAGRVGQEGDKGIDAVKEFLKKAHANKKWEIGPSQLTSDAITKVYGEKQKFYFVFSTPPLPPGANSPEAMKAYEAKCKEFRDNFISTTLRVDAAGKVFSLTKVGDYEGLMAVKNEEDVKTAAAAVLSLYGSEKVAPGVVKVTEVKATKTDDGWQGMVERKNEFQATVEFNNKGQVIKLSKIYTGPVPP